MNCCFHCFVLALLSATRDPLTIEHCISIDSPSSVDLASIYLRHYWPLLAPWGTFAGPVRSRDWLTRADLPRDKNDTAAKTVTYESNKDCIHPVIVGLQCCRFWRLGLGVGLYWERKRECPSPGSCIIHTSWQLQDLVDFLLAVCVQKEFQGVRLYADSPGLGSEDAHRTRAALTDAFTAKVTINLNIWAPIILSFGQSHWDSPEVI